ncbi:uncharacterized protein OCT59_019918 [Rhizophagus irregularis]|nr:hypothetical protein RirG_022400 [Rhizophagus irregularis DAOM 197198w]UZO27731.1 hypothetical protein OCT59_019918 [Rhizophagus irregularis]CAB4482431.1 unnamed protein product [Rhizophagus irregularis]
MLGSGRIGSIFKIILDRKTGTFKMVALYKDEKKLKELLNEIKIYIGPLKEIQEKNVSFEENNLLIPKSCESTD